MPITPADSLDALIAHGPPDATDFAKQIAGLPGAYYAGLDEAYKRRTQDAFQNLDPSKPIDLNALYKTALINQGTSAAIPIAAGINEQGKQQAVTEAMRRAFPWPGDQPPPATGSPTTQAPAIPPVTPQRPGTIAGEPVTPSIRSLLPSGLGEPDKNRLGLAIAQGLNLPAADFDAQLTPQQIAQAQPIVERYQTAQAARAPRPTTAPSTLSTVQDPEIVAQRARLEDRKARLQALAGAVDALDPKRAEALRTEIAEINKQLEPTTAEKDYFSTRLPGETRADTEARVAGAKSGAEDRAKKFNVKYEAVTKAGQEAALERPKLQLAKQLMADPNFYSGPFESQNLAYKRVLGTLSPADANAARPQEAFQKVVSDSLRSNIQALAQSGAGRVQLAEIRILEKSAANMGNTISSNRLLVELNDRVQQHLMAIREIAGKYNGGSGILDAGFDRVVDEYGKRHPLVSTDELKHPGKVAPPIFASLAAARKFGLKPNDWFETTDGRKLVVP